jgi:dTDP-4-amino-4,6-dideoxygalactose transaminase
MYRKIFRAFSVIKKNISNIFNPHFYGFVVGHSSFSSAEFELVDRVYLSPSNSINLEFENQISQIIGNGSGSAVSFASGRMAFYALLKAFGVGIGDEVILTGSTCAVMASSVMRLGAIPVYADIDPKTYGSSAEAISKCITKKTKVIVAQHSFGIPCEIVEIISLAKQNKLVLIEDCALALGSAINGKKVGNFGDAAFFSFDRTKTINTMIGGMAYSTNDSLVTIVRDIQKNCKDLPKDKVRSLYKRFYLEVKFCTPANFKFMGLIDLILWIRVAKFKFQSPFLDQDFSAKSHDAYPYPAKMPSFVAQIGLIETAQFEEKVSLYQRNLKEFLSKMTEIGCFSLLPSIYNDNSRKIVPLRMVWDCERNVELKQRSKSFFDVNSVWFQAPIVATIDPIESYGYLPGSCPVSERVGYQIMNVPSNLAAPYFKNLLLLLSKEIYGIPKYIP